MIPHTTRLKQTILTVLVLSLAALSLFTIAVASLIPAEDRIPNAGQYTFHAPEPANEMLSETRAALTLASFASTSRLAAPPPHVIKESRRGHQSLPTSTVTAIPGIASITINWTSVAGATSYTLYWGTPGSGWFSLGAVTGLTYTQSGSVMHNGQTYYYRLDATDGMHSSQSYSAPVVLNLAAPAALACYVNGSGHTILTWQGVTGAASYWVNGVVGGPVNVTGTSYDCGIISSGSFLVLSVQSYNSAGYGANSASIRSDGVGTVIGALPRYAKAQPYCPLCELLHGAGEGDPVNLSTGWEVYSPPAGIGVYNPNGVGFNFARTFTSGLASNNISSPGMPVGWTHPYDVIIRTIPAGSTAWPNLELAYPNGAVEAFAPTLSSGSPTGAFSHPTGAPYIVTGSPGTGGAWNSVTLNWKDGTTWIFTPFASETYTLTSVLNRVGQGISLTYDSNRRLTGVWDYSSTHSLASLSYDVYGLLASVDDCYGRSVFYTNGAGGGSSPELLQVSQISPTSSGPLAASNLATYTYLAPSGRLLNTITVPSPTGTGTAMATISYGGTSKISSVTDGNGNVFGFTYNTGNTVVTMKSATNVLALSYTVYYDSSFRMTAAKDANGYSKTWAYADASNPYLPTTVTDEDSNATVMTYDAFGNITSLTDPLGVTTNFTLAYTAFPLGRLTQVQTGTLSPVSFTYYEPAGLVDTVTSPAPGGGGSVTSSYAYDSLGNMTSATLPGSGSYSTRTVTLNYTTDGAYTQADAVNQPIAVTDNGGNVTHFRYDSLGRLVTQIDALGYETDFTPNIAGQVTTTTYPATGQTGTGHATTVNSYLYPGGLALSKAIYDESGTLVRTIATSYGQEGEVRSTSGTTDAVQYTYDAAYRVLTATDANSGVTSYVYDTVGNLTSETLPGGDSFSYPSYDPAHHLLQKQDANGVVTNYTYSGSGTGSLLATIDAPADSSVHVGFSYDSYGRLTTVTDATGSRTATLDDLGNVASEVTAYTGLPSKTISYGFNPDGSRSSMVSPAGTFTYDYDAVGRVASVTNPFSETTSWTYTARGDLNEQFMANSAAVQHIYNGLGNLTTLRNRKPSGILSHTILYNDSGLTYNGTLDVTSASVTIGAGTGILATGTLSYNYDSLDRLTQDASTFGSGYSFSHGYDANSNLTTLRGSTLSYNTKGQLSTSGMTFDSNGNPTTYNGTSLTFDADNRLTAFGTAMTAGYRGDGLRAWKQASGTTTYFLYDGNILLCELDGSGNVKRTYTNGVDGLISSNTSAGSIFYTFDFRGSTIERLDSSCNVVSNHASDAYGNDLSPEADPYSGFGAKFGYYHDAETGLTYLRNRYYDPAFGRFLNRDPIGLGGGMNRYGFVSGNPVTGVDPSGLDDESPLASLGSAVAAFGDFEHDLITNYWSDNAGVVGRVAAEQVTGAISSVTGALSGVMRMGSDSGEYFGGNPSHHDGWAATRDILGIALAGFGGVEVLGLEGFIGGSCEQYALIANEDGFYPVMKWGYKEPQSGIYLRKGEVWKYGQSTKGAGRYSLSELNSIGRPGVTYKSMFSGTVPQALFQERGQILNYRFMNGRLPPGNKMVR